MRSVWAGVAAAVAALAAAGVAAAEPGHALTIVSPAAVAAQVQDGSASATVVVRNAGGKAVGVRFAVAAPGGGRVAVSAVGPRDLAAGAVVGYRLTLRPARPKTDVAGVLSVHAAGAAPGTVSLTLAPKHGAPRWLLGVVFGPLGAAALFVFTRYAFYSGKNRALTTRLGPPNWSPTASWGTNLAVVGALLGTILAAGVIPDETAVSKSTYAGLNLFFGTVSVVAPLFYTATVRKKSVHRTTVAKEPQYQGYVWSFLLTAMVSLWAVGGELVTIFLLFREIRSGASLPAEAVSAMLGVVAVAGLLVVFYAWQSIAAILDDQTDVDKQRARTHALLAARGFAAVPAESAIEPALPAWPVL